MRHIVNTFASWFGIAMISTMGGVWWRPEPCRCLISHLLGLDDLLFFSLSIFDVAQMESSEFATCWH
jgi:hypothetical protein